MSRTNNARNKFLSLKPGTVCLKRPGTASHYDIFVPVRKGSEKLSAIPWVSAYNAATAWRLALEKLETHLARMSGS